MLACKWVDEVIIGAPLVVTEDLITTMNISAVLDYRETPSSDGVFDAALAVPRKQGILTAFESPSAITVSTIVGRIMAQQDMFTKRYESKAAKEADYVANKKEFIQEQ